MRAGVRCVADEHHPAAVPRSIDEQVFEPGVVDAGGVGDGTTTQAGLHPGLSFTTTDCSTDGVYEFFPTAAPLPVTGAVGAPVNPIAVK